MKQYIAAFDQGTTSSRTIIFDQKGNIVAKSMKEFRQIYPKPGWVEHDPRDIVASQLSSYREALALAGITADEIAAVGIANQRETAIVWDRFTGKPVYNAIVWQCRRTSEMCEKLKPRYAKYVYERTGLNIDAYFSASKIRWILDNVPFARRRAEKGDLLFGTVDTYLIWYLTGGKVHATDYTNASRTMLYNIHTLEWDAGLCRLFNIPPFMLPKVLPSGADFGETDASVLGAALPIRAAVGDQQAALFGQLCVRAGEAKNTYGTGCFLLMNTGKQAVASQNGLITTLTASLGAPDYALEGSVFVGGAVVQWLRDGLGLIDTAAETEAAALSVEDTGGVTVVPAFVGLGAPHWDPECRGVICGITRGTTAAHIIRASLEAIALQTFDIVHAMEQDLRINLSRLCVDGGASANNFLMQFQADILGADVVRPAVMESTALGAAYLAGLSCGYFKDIDSLRAEKGSAAVFMPHMSGAARAEKLRTWEQALSRTMYRVKV
ncbi:MAG TPA: glycerol kinase GlpK [Candidatus Borkfalkia faecavium]|uniref:Glycerol kinase n=1 Tax=Candidatus Borkfalkia faecavium TaxID=2838508 RepID=A0A9D1VZM2_9FIRM|nr:glycerol kinase GlpK [Candidatus Borkfalkia faecavium]